MAKFITPSVTPNPPATNASSQARRRTMPDSVRHAPRPPSSASTSAAAHSRSVVTDAGETVENMRAAMPAPSWTETMPVRTSAAEPAVARLTPTGSLPPEDAGRQRDGADRPDHECHEVAHRKRHVIGQHAAQAGGQRPGRQQLQYVPDPGRELGQREHHAT